MKSSWWIGEFSSILISVSNAFTLLTQLGSWGCSYFKEEIVDFLRIALVKHYWVIGVLESSFATLNLELYPCKNCAGNCEISLFGGLGILEAIY